MVTANTINIDRYWVSVGLHRHTIAESGIFYNYLLIVNNFWETLTLFLLNVQHEFFLTL